MFTGSSFDTTRSAARRGTLALLAAAAIVASGSVSIRAQGVDCARLQAQIVQGGGGGSNGGNARAARQTASELARTRAAAHQLGCDRGGFLFFGGSDNPQCPGLNARASQLEATLGRLQESGGSGNDLVARYNAYCRGQQPRERGFFESIFGSPDTPPPPAGDLPPEPDAEPGTPHGGSQAVCVRSCDGGFFPLAMSSRHSAESLTEMCSALCPGTEATVYTRNPDSEIKSAVGLDGKPYMDMPNALKFQKSYTPACTCLPPGKTWAEVLANAEEVLGSERKGDILVTQEKSDELSRPKADTTSRGIGLRATQAAPDAASALAADPPPPPPSSKPLEETGPDGVKRLVRRVGPQP